MCVPVIQLLSGSFVKILTVKFLSLKGTGFVTSQIKNSLNGFATHKI